MTKNRHQLDSSEAFDIASKIVEFLSKQHIDVHLGIAAMMIVIQRLKENGIEVHMEINKERIQ